MAEIGLLYGRDPYDMERYRRVLQIAGAMLGAVTAEPLAEVQERLSADIGYITVKVGVAAAVFDATGRQLLVQRRDNGLWAQPGGWADVGESPAAMAEREVWEETGLRVHAERLVGLYDSRQRGFRHPHHIYHLVFLCTILEGAAAVTAETLAFGWFAPDAMLPPLSPGHQPAIADAFDAWADRRSPVIFD